MWKKGGYHDNDDNDLIVARMEDNDGPIHRVNKKKRNNCHALLNVAGGGRQGGWQQTLTRQEEVGYQQQELAMAMEPPS